MKEEPSGLSDVQIRQRISLLRDEIKDLGYEIVDKQDEIDELEEELEKKEAQP